MTIDWWTLGLQAVNVIVLVWLLGRFFWRPVAAMIEQRRLAARQILAEAEGQRTAAAAALAEIEHTRAGFAEEREAILAASHAAAERARAALLEQADMDIAARNAAANEAIEKQRKAAEKAWAERAGQLAITIAERLVLQLEGPSVHAAFLDRLLVAIKALPDQTRQSVASSAATLEAVSATALSPAEQQRYRELISAAFGAEPRIEFKTDPALIAGLELHGPHLLISNSWRADLHEISTDLDHDSRP